MPRKGLNDINVPDTQRIARFDAAFELVYFTRSDDGTMDAVLIRRATGKIVTAPHSRSAIIRVDPRLQASFYQVKLGLHLGRIPRPQVDHKNLDWRDHRLCNLREATPTENARNRRTPRKANASLRKGVRKYRGHDGRTNAYGAQVNDAGGFKDLGYFPIAKDGKPLAKRLAEEAADAHYRKRDGRFHPHKNGETAEQ